MTISEEIARHLEIDQSRVSFADGYGEREGPAFYVDDELLVHADDIVGGDEHDIRWWCDQWKKSHSA